MVTQSLSEADEMSGSYRSEVSLYVVKPQFSIAPDWKSGIAIRSGTDHKINNAVNIPSRNDL